MQARGCFYRDFIRHILCRLSLLIKLIVRTDSGAPELSLNYAAIYLGYWGGFPECTEHFFFLDLFFPCVCLCIKTIFNH